jgi:signal transduction histidine kinase
MSLDAAAGDSAFTRRLLDQITTGIVTVDRQLKVSFANRVALDTLTLTLTPAPQAESAPSGQSVLEAFGHSPELSRALADLGAGGERRIDFTLPKPPHTEVGMTVMRASGDAPSEIAFVLLFRNLAERRQLELELRRVERLTALGQMVAGFAHEVRNPLAGIQALAETLLAETAAADPLQEHAHRILALLARVERFIKASLEFAEPRPADRRRRQPAALVAAALAALAPRVGHGPPPTATVDEGVGLVDVDEAQIVECLLALIENALDAVGDVAGVEVKVSALDDDSLVPGASRVVCFEVWDRGPGIPPALISRVFDPFFTTKAKGTGLGLTLAHTLARENGGRLLVRSRAFEETVFTLALPEAQP